jgi:serine/threonine-protein phosphatase CPPED1
MTPFRFVFMADCQLGCYASFSGMAVEETQRYAARNMRVAAVPPVEGWEWDARRFEEAVDAANRLRPQFVIVGGDMVDDPADEGQHAEVQRIAARLKDIPVHWVAGNHDAADDCLVPTSASLAAYRARYGPDCYAFQHADTSFIIVNTVVWDHPERVPDQLGQQLAFFETALRDARRDGSRHILVFGHHPPFTEHAAEPDSYWNIPLARRRDVLRLLRDFGARAFFAGHWHRNGGGWDGELEVVVTGPVGYPLGGDPSGFRVVDVTSERVDHRYVALAEITTAGVGS